MKSFRQFITELSADAVKAKRAAMVSGQPENKKEDTIFAKRPEQLSVSDFIYLTNLVGNENI